MRVLWFSNTPAAGDEFISSNGTGGWLKSLDRAIQDRIELHVAFYNRNYPKEFKVGKTTYHQLALLDTESRVKRKFQKFLGRQPDVFQWLDLIERIKPDVIHIHGTEKPWILLAEHTNIPVILSIQAILTVMNHKYFSGINKNDLYRGCSYLKAYKDFKKEEIIERQNLQFVRFVMGRTDWDRRVYSILAPNARYFEGGEILRESFYRLKWEAHERNDGKIIVHTTTGALLFKGLETVCGAVTELKRIGVDIEWRVAGVAENSELVKTIQDKMGEDFPKQGLQLLGSLNEEELVYHMLEADVYVSPSHQDNSPNALCEATMIGMPCIGTFAGGTGSIIKDGFSGILVQDGDPWAMAGAVLELARNKQLALSYAENAYADAMVKHSKDKVVEQVMSAYSYIIKGKE